MIYHCPSLNISYSHFDRDVMKKHFVLLLQITLLGLLSAYPSILPSLDPTALVSSLSLPPSCLVDQMPVEPNFDKERVMIVVNKDICVLGPNLWIPKT